MEQDELRWKLIRSMRGQSECFVNPAPNGKYSFLKKLGKKLTYWYVYPFGEAQNRFNDSVASLIEQVAEDIERLTERIGEMETQTERRFVTFTREQRLMLERSESTQKDALEQIQKTIAEGDEKQRKRMTLFEESQRKTLTITRTEQMRAIEDISQRVQQSSSDMDALFADIDRSLCAAAPECRKNAGKPALLHMDGIPAAAIAEQLRMLDSADDVESKARALETLDSAYTRLLCDTLETQVNSGNIVFVCREFTGEAGQRELWELYQLMKRCSRYHTVILSVEADDAPEMIQGDIYRVPEAKLPVWMRRYDPVLLIFCEENPSLLAAGEQCMMLRDSIVRLSAQNPVEKIGGSRMQELLHLSDYGVQHYLAGSSAAADAFEQLGFSRPTVTAPYIDINHPALYRKPHPYNPKMFTVGYVDDTQNPDAAALFLQIVQANPDIDFLLLSDGALPAEAESLPNLDCCDDLRERHEFYEEIDCVLVPYVGKEHVPAVPLSALDGMVMGIPAVCTPAAGIAEWIAQTGTGVVADECTAEAVSAALCTLRTDYAAYRESWQIEKLRDLVSGKEFVCFAEECAAHRIPFGMVTLYDWDRAVKQEQSHLVRGSAMIRAYFQRRTLPAQATDYPQAAFDLMERRSAEALLRHFYPDAVQKKHILALGGEDEQMLTMLMQFGECVFADASEAVNAQRTEDFAGKPAEIRKMDILAGDLEGEYDLIAVFRLIRHCEHSMRRQVWARLSAALAPDGMILTDIPNLMHLVPCNQQLGWGRKAVYEVGWTQERIEKELAENGLCLAAMLPVGEGLYPLAKQYEKEPVSWTAVIKKSI